MHLSEIQISISLPNLRTLHHPHSIHLWAMAQLLSVFMSLIRVGHLWYTRFPDRPTENAEALFSSSTRTEEVNRKPECSRIFLCAVDEEEVGKTPCPPCTDIVPHRREIQGFRGDEILTYILLDIFMSSKVETVTAGPQGLEH